MTSMATAKQLLELIACFYLLCYVVLFSSPPTLKTSKVEAEFPASSIRIGSSIAASTSPSYWLSPSGIFAFGFYPSSDDSNQYTVGIWLEKSPCKTLIWSYQSQPISNASSILLTHDGLFLQNPGVTSILLLGNGAINSPSYAIMQDNGNFVLYDSYSNVSWQSFDHPTDTIISGQKLKSGYNLRTSSLLPNRMSVDYYQLRMQKDGDLAVVGCKINENTGEVTVHSEWNSDTSGESVELNLDTTGRLYLSESDGTIVKTLVGADPQGMDGTLMSRATLESDGAVLLYKENMDEENEHPYEIWHGAIKEQKLDDARVEQNLVVLQVEQNQDGCESGMEPRGLESRGLERLLEAKVEQNLGNWKDNLFFF